MPSELEKVIATKDKWTFDECLDLAHQFKTKVRMVVAMVYQQGKEYIDKDEQR